jgi:hypothetical protein
VEPSQPGAKLEKTAVVRIGELAAVVHRSYNDIVLIRYIAHLRG